MEASTAETASMAPCTSPVVIMSRTASQRARVSHRCASAACVCAHQPSQLECLSVLRLVLSLPGLLSAVRSFAARREQDRFMCICAPPNPRCSPNPNCCPSAARGEGSAGQAHGRDDRANLHQPLRGHEIADQGVELAGVHALRVVRRGRRGDHLQRCLRSPLAAFTCL